MPTLGQRSTSMRASTPRSITFSTMLAVAYLACVLLIFSASGSLAPQASTEADCGDSSVCHELQGQLYATLREQDAFMRKYDALQGERDTLRGERDTLQDKYNALLHTLSHRAKRGIRAATEATKVAYQLCSAGSCEDWPQPSPDREHPSPLASPRADLPNRRAGRG